MEKLLRSFDYLTKKTGGFKPEIGLVLGSGFNDVANKVDVKFSVPYSDIEGFPVSTVHGHKGQFLFGTINNVKVVVMQGRVHYYEGYSIRDVVLPIRLMAMTGIKALLLTNAAGGVNRTFRAGSVMAITDHIMLNVPNPLIGPNLEKLGTRFPDMTFCYDKQLLQALETAAEKENIKLEKGVYYMVSGPSFETPAEIRFISVAGGDAVGMSTAPEAVAAFHAGVRVCGISFISNIAAGLSGGKLSHEEVNQAANENREKLDRLLCRCVEEIKKTL